MTKFFSAILLLVGLNSAFAQDANKVNPFAPYHATIGLVVNPKGLGMETELNLWKQLKIRLIASRLTGFEKQGELNLTGLAFLTYYFPCIYNTIEPYAAVGAFYSYYNWKINNNVGIIRDANVGAGVGINLRLYPYVKIGLACLIANSPVEAYLKNQLQVQYHSPAIFPALTFDYIIW